MKRGPKNKKIDFALFEQLCALHCTLIEICSALKVTDKTLNHLLIEHYGDKYSAICHRFRAIGKISLRRRQMKLAEKFPHMAIFLGKNWLGQQDTPLIDQSTKIVNTYQHVKVIIDDNASIPFALRARQSIKEQEPV